MKKLPMAAAVAVVLGAPLAFAADNNNLPSPSAMTTLHCPNLETPSPINGSARDYSSAKQQAAEEEAMSLCRQDRHKNGGIQLSQTGSRPHGAPLLLFVRR